MAFADAQWEQGFELFSRRVGFSRRLRVADCVLTGEGALDASTAMGKGVGQLAEMCRKRGIPCVGLAGVVVGSRKLAGLFTKTHALTEVTTLAKAKQNASAWLERLAAKAASDWRPLEQAKA
jgi:glycerate kinase